jgi:ubiquitin C-terminal hydrolase
MSSSIQCLSHAIGLTNYFLQGHFKDELNYKNPLGAKGQLAIAYGKLLKQLWYDDQPFLSPWQFKKTIGRFASNVRNLHMIKDALSSTTLISKILKSC